MFLAVGLLGLVIAGAVLAYPPEFAKPIIITVEIALVVSIAVTLALLLAGPAEREAAP